jgi:DNA-binding transcriptional ArsR family regulator
MLREMDAVFKALADESRRALLDQLHKSNGQTLGELCAHLDMTRQAVTKHLLLLEAANLVVVAWAREAALPQPGADPRDLRALDW